MVTQQRALETRDALLASAGNAFGTHGYARTSLVELAAAHGLTTGALYFHFKSKEDLAKELIRAEGSVAREFVATQMAQPYDAHLDKLISVSMNWAELIVTNPIVSAGVRLIMERPEFVDPDYQPYPFWLTLTERLLSEADAAGELRPALNIRAIAHTVTANFIGVDLLSGAMTQHQDFEQRIRDMWEFASLALRNS